MKKDLIVAKYREDPLWTGRIDTTTFIYNKGAYDTKFINLPNVGREAHTFFYHIAKNYNNLADVNIFVQGAPFDHTPDLLKILDCKSFNCMKHKTKRMHPDNVISSHFISLGKCWSYQRPCLWDKNHRNPHIQYVYKKLYGCDMPPVKRLMATWGGQFAATRDCLQQYPHEFYVDMEEYAAVEHNWAFAWAMEVIWIDLLHNTKAQRIKSFRGFNKMCL